MRDLVSRINYDVYTTGNDWYLNGSKRPSYEFRDKAWKWGEVEKTVNLITKELYYSPEDMTTDADGWKHWSNVKGKYYGDSRPYLAAILNELHDDPYTSSMKFGSGPTLRYFSHARRRYWDNFISDLFEGKKLQRYFDEALRSKGVVRR